MTTNIFKHLIKTGVSVKNIQFSIYAMRVWIETHGFIGLLKVIGIQTSFWFKVWAILKIILFLLCQQSRFCIVDKCSRSLFLEDYFHSSSLHSKKIRQLIYSFIFIKAKFYRSIEHNFRIRGTFHENSHTFGPQKIIEDFSPV